MSGTAVRLGESARATLRDLAARDGESMDAVLEKAIECYRGQRSLEEANASSAAPRAEEALRESEARFRTLFDSSRDSLMTLAPPSWRFTSCNPAAVEMFGVRDEAEFTSLGPWELSPELQPDGRPSTDKAAEAIETAMREGSYLFEWTHRRLGGEDFPATVLLSRTVINGEAVLQATVRDVTAQRRAEVALRESEARFRTLFDSSRDSLMTAGPPLWRFTSCNPAALDMFGVRDEAEFASLGPWDVSPELQPDGRTSAESIREAIETAMREGSYLFEWTHRRLRGEEFPATILLSRMQIGGETVLQGTIRDITAQRRAEVALRESEARFRTLFDSSRDSMMIIAPPSWRFTSSNPAALEMFGVRDEDELTSLGPWDVSPELQPDGRSSAEKAQEAIETAMRAGSYLFEWTHRRLRGEDFLATVLLSRTEISGEAVLQATVRDITAQRRAEEALRESEARFRGLFDNAISAVAVHEIVVDEHGRPVDFLFLEANPAFERQTGLRPADVLGRRATEVLPGIEETPLLAIYGNVALTGEPIQFEQFVEPLHRHYSISAYGMGPGRFATALQDITKRKLAEEALRDVEEALREVEERHHTVVEAAQDAIIMLDPDGSITMWNESAVRIFGYAADEVTGRDLHELLAPERFRGEFRRSFPEFQHSGAGGAVGNVLELAAVRKGGEEFPVEVSLSAVRLQGGWHAIGVVRDITQRRQADEALRTALAAAEALNAQLEEQTLRANDLAVRAEAASAAKGEFLANMSHEIRTPMNGVIGMTDLLLDTDLSEEQRRYAEVARASGESLLGVINDILDFSKIEAGKLELEMVDFDLCSLLEDFASAMAARIYEKGLEFSCAAGPAVPSCLRGDPGRLRQVLTNLVGNAVKFTHHGEVSVRVALVSETDDAAVLRFSVRDTGIGIPPDKVGVLFDAFAQVDPSTTRHYGGTGLGLAISRQLAELMGGEIGVDSAEGLGSEFWFTACFGESEESDSAGMAGLPANIGATRVLVVDDNATNREVLSALLVRWGAEPSEAPDGPSALRALRLALGAGEPFQVAIVDAQMPGMDGEALGRAIKADDTLRDTLLVTLTSLGQRGDAIRFADIGYAGYLTKPVRQSELRDCLALVLAGGTMRPRPGSLVTRHSAREVHRSSVRILLAEDSTVNRLVALGMLRKLGLRADAVANGAEAVKALTELPYDLVLMDVQMPEMDGMEATRVIRDPQSSVRNHAIPIIAMTAHAMQGDRERCLQAGMNGYLAKPVRPEALAGALEEWLPREPRGSDTAGLDTPAALPSEAAGGSEAPIFDRAGLMDRAMDDEELAQVVIGAFLEDTPKQIEALSGYISAGDLAGAGRQAHTIGGAAANAGGEALCRVAFAMEAASETGSLEDIAMRMPDLEREFGRLRQAMEQAGYRAPGTEGDGR